MYGGDKVGYHGKLEKGTAPLLIIPFFPDLTPEPSVTILIGNLLVKGMGGHG